MTRIRSICILLSLACPLASAEPSSANPAAPAALTGPVAGAAPAASAASAASAVPPSPGNQALADHHAVSARPAATAPGLAIRFRRAPAAALEQLRGGSDAIASDTRLNGATNGNSAAYVVTGSNLIQSGSFANATGVPVVIQNSGANVLIQNATVVNVQFQSP